ncbi:MAG: hypothetical protein QG661_2530 [Actinomycetota bacterium]|nr:hypothetical protein [Actinomycetota bacterium]
MTTLALLGVVAVVCAFVFPRAIRRVVGPAVIVALLAWLWFSHDGDPGLILTDITHAADAVVQALRSAFAHLQSSAGPVHAPASPGPSH